MSAPLDATSPARSPGKGLQVGLWIVQGLLAAVFLMAGGMKLLTPIAELSQKMPWVAQAPWLPRFIGAAEVAGALGVILPAATRIKPGLTALAALGLLTIMVLAVPFHFMQNDAAHAPIPAVLGLLAAFVAWGRYRKLPIAPRG
ncbi:MAG: DoxX family protein [Myxococcales bacterium]